MFAPCGGIPHGVEIRREYAADSRTFMPNLAANLVRNCLRITPDDNVTVSFYPHMQKLAEEVAIECFKVGADALLNLYTDAYYTAYMKYLPAESLRKPSVFCRGLTELSTAEIGFWAAYDPAIYRAVPDDKMAANDEGETIAHQPATERKVRRLEVALGQVTRPRAKAYGFPFAPWGRMVREASSVTPSGLSRDGKKLAAVLEKGRELRITAPNGTDLTLALKGRSGLVNDGVVDAEDIERGALEAAIPAGSVSVVPDEGQGDGTAAFDIPTAWAGRSIRRLRWELSGGRVTSWDGDAVATRLKGLWEKAAGDRDRIAWVSIGLNPRAKLGFLQNGIVRGAVTLGIGGNEFLGGANKPGFNFESAIADATVEVDGKPVVRNGQIVTRS